MFGSVWKMTLRTIRRFLGRYLALLLIVGLSVGFFSGLKITKDAMYRTCQDYLEEHQFYDYYLASSLGFAEEDADTMAELEGVALAECTKNAQVLLRDSAGESGAYQVLSLPDTVNLPSLVAGRLPETEGECLGDARYFEEAEIGTTLTVSAENTQEDADQLAEETYTLVGIADSPLYISNERGTATIGNGTFAGFVYLLPAAFSGDTYTALYLTLSQQEDIYSDAYDHQIDAMADEIQAAGDAIVAEDYEALLAAHGITAQQAPAAGIPDPVCYTMTRSENAGYVSFENDASIISGIANIFPLLFVMIAALVCTTTMTRMVEEERIQIGTLKALGFRRRAIRAKYLLYAGSGALFGWLAGFFLGTWGLPQVFWFAYSSIYGFAPLVYLFRPALALLTLGVTLAVILAATWYSTHRALLPVPAALLNPASPKGGKRILLERITPLWRRLGFLPKVILRNMLRYKRRLVMMLLGIGCCTALMVTAFGARDSMIHVGSLQYQDIQTYDLEISADATHFAAVESWAADAGQTAVAGAVTYGTLEQGDKSVHNVHALTFRDNQWGDAWRFRDIESGAALTSPEEGHVLLSAKAAQRLEVATGDTVTLVCSGQPEVTLTVDGIFENYIYHYIVLSPDTLASAWGAAPVENTLYLQGDASPEAVLSQEGVTSVTQIQAVQSRIDSALSCLDYIILMIVLFSGALAFLVTYNLTNINIAERLREIATVQVLGFYPKETYRYVLYENILLSALAGGAGMLLGIGFHRAVMAAVDIEMMRFQLRISPFSFVLAFVLTLVFAWIVNLAMRHRIRQIEMAQALKAGE